MAIFQAKRRLGQNFLKDHRVLARIAEVLEIQPTDMVVEIGPGHGELTRKLLGYAPERLLAIEKDSDLIRLFLDDISKEYPNLEVLEGDALDELPKIDFAYKLVGNIPYYITGYLLRLLQELEYKPQVTVFTLQKEVAKRLCAAPPEMNLLAATLQFWAEPRIVRFISKKSFKPAPKVDSAVVKIVPLSPQPTEKEAEAYYTFVKALFKQPRKTILNNLKPLGATKETLQEAGINPGDRPQNLSIEDIRKLVPIFTHK